MATRVATTRASLDKTFVRDFSQRYFEAWNSRDPERVLALMTDDILFEDPVLPEGSARGQATLRGFLRSIWRAFPDLTVAMRNNPLIAIDGSRAAVELETSGTFLGPLDPPGYGPTGTRGGLAAMELWEFEGDKLRHVRAFADTMEMGRQMGLMPKPGSRTERVGVVLQRALARRMRRQVARGKVGRS
jgi:steroid delta-isomerase-like uncharacterized protein